MFFIRNLDVLGSAKGWAASILFHDKVKEQFTRFYNRPDTFSLGVCNGCQLMALIGWVGSSLDDEFSVPDITLEHNKSERFECRWSTVRIEKSKAIMLQRMEGSAFGVWVFIVPLLLQLALILMFCFSGGSWRGTICI